MDNCRRLINLMSYLPALKSRLQNKFTNPLSGFVYDNKKYAESCFIEAMPSRNSSKCKSPAPRPVLSSQEIKERDFRLTKVMNLTKRLSDHNKMRCTRNKWMQDDSDTSIQVKRTAPIDQFMPTKHREAEMKPFHFPQIRALILSIFRSPADHDKVCKLTLKNYFQLFFKDTLAGIIFQELIAIVDRHLHNIAIEEEQRFDGSDISVQLDNEYANILTKQELYNKLQELQNQGKMQQAERLVRAYCLPAREVRGVFMQDLLKLIAVQLYENFNCKRNSQYVLLRDDGQPITDFSAIGFSTASLFIAEKDSAAEQYQRYIEITQNHSRLKNRFQFREQLKLNFRQKVAKGNFIDSSNTPEKSVRQAIHERRNNVDRAQMIVDCKNEKNSASRVRMKQGRNTSEVFRETKSKSRSKSQEKLTIQREQQLKRSPFSIDVKIEDEFKMLKHKNDFANSILKNNEQARDKIEIGLLTKESVYFREKSMPQIDRILIGLGFIQNGEQFEDYHQRLITINDYARMRKIINCVGEREHTIRFVDRYLSYDQFGELRREDFSKVLAFIVGEGKTTDVILKTIWTWMQHNGVTSNSSIRRLDMQILYERNKLVYYFLISLIFGTNEVSVLELTQDMLVDG